MKNYSINYAVLGALLVSLTGCPGDDNETESATNTTPGTTTQTTPGTTTMTTPGTTGTTDDMTTDPTGGPTTDPTTTTTTMTTDPMTGTTGDPGGYNFPDNPFDDYTQIDRHAAVEAGTAAILAPAGLGLNGEDISLRDMYNASNPVEDRAGKWVPEIVKSITFFHDALDDDIMGFNLVPATVDETVAQAGPVIIPDTIKYDPAMPTAYPNGRKLTDQVVDITLAAVLLKLGGNQPLNTFAMIPLNPATNDLPFKTEFPFLADPH
jgi:hypothetical protein